MRRPSARGDRSPNTASGATRRSSGGIVRRTREGDLPDRKDPPDACRHVLARERRARDVLDVGAELELARGGFSLELREPARIADLAAVAFSIFEDLDRRELAIRIDAHCVRDEVLAADDLVDERV